MAILRVRDGAAALDRAGWGTAIGAERAGTRRWRSVAVLMAVLAAIAGSAGAADRWLRVTTLDSRPIAPLPAAGLFAEPVTVAVTISAGVHRAPWLMTEDELRQSVEAWKRMHLEDWDAVRPSLRAAGLDAMLLRYAHLLNDPAAWDRMTVHDWDAVPQPVRTVAYRRMVAYWSGFYDVGAEFNLPPGTVADTLAAIVMSESWFDHRARSLHRDGTWDVGLAQASSFARERVRQLHAAGIVDAALGDEEYRNPWMATRFVALWMKLMLDESAGDLDRAVRAYNRGSGDAMDSLGADYLAAVQRRLLRYIRNGDAPAAWDHVWRRSRQLMTRWRQPSITSVIDSLPCLSRKGCTVGHVHHSQSLGAGGVAAREQRNQRVTIGQRRLHRSALRRSQ